MTVQQCRGVCSITRNLFILFFCAPLSDLIYFIYILYHNKSSAAGHETKEAGINTYNKSAVCINKTLVLYIFGTGVTGSF